MGPLSRRLPFATFVDGGWPAPPLPSATFVDGDATSAAPAVSAVWQTYEKEWRAALPEGVGGLGTVFFERGFPGLLAAG